MRDITGLLLMFVMPIILVFVITIMQYRSFESIGDHKVKLLVCNNDGDNPSQAFVKSLEELGLFKIQTTNKSITNQQLVKEFERSNAMVAIVIPNQFSNNVLAQSHEVSSKALVLFGLEPSISTLKWDSTQQVILLYDPVLQPNFKLSIEGAVSSALQMIGSKYALRNLFQEINGEPMPDSVEKQMLKNDMQLKSESISAIKGALPNATTHNVPAWTLFAMFFIVVSLGASIINEKRKGSFVRLKAMPTNFYTALLSKQITYFLVTMLQAILLFSIGFFVFEHIGLPRLHLPNNILAFIYVTILSGLCAVSFAQMVGTFANTADQGNAFGAIATVILAIIGGLMIPSYMMPDSFKTLMQFSPLYWSLELYNNIFLKGSSWSTIVIKTLPLILFIITFQGLSLWGLKRKKII